MAAIDFPQTPSVGQEVISAGKTWMWTGEVWVTVTAPVSIFPAGVIFPFAGAAVPPGFLLCYGQLVSRNAYPKLFAALGTLYGTGDGSTTFGIPDFRGRMLAGADNMGGTAANRISISGGGPMGGMLGATGGADRITLGTAELPAHSHTAGDSGHAHGVSDGTHGHTVYDPTHRHNQMFIYGSSAYGAQSGSSYYAGRLGVRDTADNGYDVDAGYTGVSNYASYTGVGVATAYAVIVVNNTGGGGAHHNMPPTAIVNHIIATGEAA